MFDSDDPTLLINILAPETKTMPTPILTYKLHGPDLTGWWSWECVGSHHDGYTSARAARADARRHLGEDALESAASQLAEHTR